jgi:uncharacterized protein with ParB-like and HNH nuclease domain
MELNAVTKSAGDIFSVNKRYLVPRFQREYSWTKDEVDEFWDDILQQIKLQNKKPVNEEYFIGCIVLVGEDSKRDYTIVDGQQRLTTLTIFLRAIVERLKELGESTAATALYKNVIEGTDDDGQKYFKLVNETPKPYFQNELQIYTPEGVNTAITDEEQLLQATYAGFLKRLRGLAIHGLAELDSIKILRNQVLNYLKFILVTAKSDDDAYTIFETLNARGLSLTSVDLIKNWIFKNDKSVHPNDNAKEIWSGIRKAISEFSDLETFFRHYWNSKFSLASNDRLYKSFNDALKTKKVGLAREFLLELKNASGRYRKIGMPSEKDWGTQKEKAVARHLILINQYKVTQVRPFLLALMECRESKFIDETLFIRTIWNLENFHLVFSNICQDRAAGLESKYSRSARALYTANGDKAKIKTVISEVKEFLQEKFPTRQHLADSMKTLVFNNGNDVNKKTIQAIFSKIEQHLQKTTELTVGSFSLEHIQDQSSDAVWGDGVGNLIPLDEKLNNEIKSKPKFKDKKVVYQKSQLTITKHFLELNTQETWKETDAGKWLDVLATKLHEATTLQ